MMIEVNLLPAELRRIERTPLPRFLVIIVGIAAVLSTAMFGVIVNLRKVPDLEAKQTALVRQIQVATPTAEAWDKLQDEIGDAQARKLAIAELWRTRICWSAKLAQLSQMVPGFVGFTEVRLEDNRGGQQDTGGMFTIESLISGSDLDRVAQWRKTLQAGKTFYASFLDVLPTETQLVAVREEQYLEKEALRVSIKMPLKTPAARMAEATQAIQDEMNRTQTMPLPASLPLKPEAAAPAAPSVPVAPAAPEAPKTAEEPKAAIGATPASLDASPDAGAR